MSRAFSAVSWAKGAPGGLSLWIILVGVGACGTAAPLPPRAPDTAADPLPFTPPPTMEASAGEVTGLVAVDNGNVAIDVVRSFFEAAASGTAEEMEAFLSEPLTMHFRGRRRPSVARRLLSQQFLNIRRARGSLALDTLVDANAMEFTTIDPQLSLEANDRAVRVPIASQGRDILGPILGWTGASGIVYVRPRLRQIVAF